MPAQWWELFRSRHLNDLIEQGIAHNADLQAAEAAVRVAQANALAQRGALFPTVDGELQSEPAAGADPGARHPTPPSGASIYSLHTAQVTVAYVPDVFGGTRRQIEVAEALAEAQAFQREGVYLTLTANIALAAIQEASLRGQIAATRRLIEHADAAARDPAPAERRRARSRCPTWWRRRRRSPRRGCCCRRSSGSSTSSATCSPF